MQVYQIIKFPDKDPNEELDFGLDWTQRLIVNNVADRIISSSWAVPGGGLTITAQSFLNNDTTVWLEGGTAGQTYTVTNTVVTAGNRTMVQSATLKITPR